jgi:hypothetical protein
MQKLIKNYLRFGIYFSGLLFVSSVGKYSASADVGEAPILDRYEGHSKLLHGEVSSEFRKILDALSFQSKSAIIVEGISVQAYYRLSKNHDKTSLISETASIRNPRNAIQFFCDEYDYDIARNESEASSTPDVIVLRKRFSEPTDLPDVTKDECLESLISAKRLMLRLNKGTSADIPELTKNSLRSFSSEDLKRLSSSGIPVRDLTEEQREWFVQIANYFYLAKPLETLKKCEVLLKASDDFILVSGSKIQQDDQNQLDILTKDSIGSIRIPINQLAPDLNVAPLLPSAILPDLETISAETPSTLGNSISLLPSHRIDVSPTISAKTIFISGAKYGDLAHLVRGMAKVYGLHAVGLKDQSWQISPQQTPGNVSVQNLYAIIKQVLPLSLIRSSSPPGEIQVLQQKQREFNLANQRYVPGQTLDQRPETKKPEALFAMAKEIEERKTNLFYRRGRIAHECVRRVEFLYRKKAGNKDGIKIPLKDLGPEAQKYVAIMIMQGFLNALEQVAPSTQNMSPPGYIQRFDDLIAIGDQNKEVRWVGIGRPQEGAPPTIIVRMGIPVK